MQFSWKVTKITDLEHIGQNQLPKRSIIITENVTEYPNSIKLDALKEKVSLLNNIKVWDDVVAEFNTRVSEHNNNHYNNLSLRKITKTSEDTFASDSDLPFK